MSQRRAYPNHSGALALALALAWTCSCRAFDPTIPERAGDSGWVTESSPISLAEEHPDLLLPAPVEEARTRHSEVLATEAQWPSVGDDQPVSVEFRAAPLGQVLLFLSQNSGLNFQLDPQLDRPVDVSFPNVTVDDALRAVLSGQGLRLVEDPPGIYRVVEAGGRATVSATFRLQSISAADIADNLQALVSTDTRLVVDGDRGLVMLRGPREEAESVAEYLDAVDRLRRQVLIEARILEVTLTDAFELGIANQIDGLGLDGSTFDLLQNLATSDQSFALTWTSRDASVQATINAISRYVGTDLVSSPRVLALSGMPANISVVREVPYVNTTATTSGTTGGVGTQTIEEVEFKEAGVKLLVTPTIQEGGAIHMHIEQELSEVVDLFNEIPVLDTRTLNTDFLVQDRQTVVLGGLMQDSRRETDEGVPGLKDVPLLGRLFRSDDDELRKRELVVFLTPRIVDAEEASRLVQAMRTNYADRLRQDGVRPVDGPVESTETD